MKKLIILLFAILPIFCFAQLTKEEKESLAVMDKKMSNVFERQEMIIAIAQHLQVLKDTAYCNFITCIEDKNKKTHDCFQQYADTLEMIDLWLRRYIQVYEEKSFAEGQNWGVSMSMNHPLNKEEAKQLLDDNKALYEATKLVMKEGDGWLDEWGGKVKKSSALWDKLFYN